MTNRAWRFLDSHAALPKRELSFRRVDGVAWTQTSVGVLSESWVGATDTVEIRFFCNANSSGWNA